jgi:hypothetical protein
VADAGTPTPVLLSEHFLVSMKNVLDIPNEFRSNRPSLVTVNDAKQGCLLSFLNPSGHKGGRQNIIPDLVHSHILAGTLLILPGYI